MSDMAHRGADVVDGTGDNLRGGNMLLSQEGERDPDTIILVALPPYGETAGLDLVSSFFFQLFTIL
jgi:hypothetical protein